MPIGSSWRTIAAAAAMAAAVAAPVAAQQLDYLPKNSLYKTYKKQPTTPGRLAHVPVVIDEVTREEFFTEDRARGLLPLLEVLNAHLDTLGISTPIATTGFPAKGRPYAFIGSSEAETAPPGSEMMREEHHDFPPMVVYVKKPSKEWRARLQAALAETGAEHVLVVSLALVEYPKAKDGTFGKKVVLGTGHEEGIRTLSAIDEPVEVLQIWGMVLNAKGDVVRAGAEGIVHEDTPFWAQVLDLAKGVDEETVREVILGQRREDLSGRPPAWRAALDTLLAQLTGDPSAR